MKTRVGVYAAATWNGKILLTQLAQGCYNAGHWALPGGGMDYGEQPEETLVREVYEETGLKASNLAIFDSSAYSEQHKKGPFMKVQIVYTADIQGTPQVIEVDGTTADVAWVPLDEVAKLPTVSVVDRIIALLSH